MSTDTPRNSHNTMVLKDLRLDCSNISLGTSGPDAMNPAGNYSAAHIRLKVNTDLVGHGIAFTIGGGNDLCTAVAGWAGDQLVGQTLGKPTTNMGQNWLYLISDSQMRWIGSEKSALHLRLSVLINALLIIWGKYLNKPGWKLGCDVELVEVVRCIDFRYIVDAITSEEALEMAGLLRKTKDTRLEDARVNETGLDFLARGCSPSVRMSRRDWTSSSSKLTGRFDGKI
ncbi:hypothetical protein CcaCcLH18_12008 [Colletotrichum camelliae]|nr:hypothetical protein CcaCcLH18_12008 [Colletotrichum camelliae]